MQITYCFYQAYIIFVKIYKYTTLLKENNPLNIRGLFKLYYLEGFTAYC